MLLKCPSCAHVHSAQAEQGTDAPSEIVCSCGTTISVPAAPKETLARKFREQFGERFVCGLVGAVFCGGVSIAASGQAVSFRSIAGAIGGFCLGAVLGEKLLERYDNR